MSLLVLRNIHKSYYLGKKESKVLNGISLKFEHGEFVSLLGESGGGKSTLMNIIGGLDSNYQGDVFLNGKSLKHDTNKQLDEYRRKTIGFIFQNFNLISHMTILENVRIALEMSDLSKSKQVERSKELLEEVGLGAHIHKHPNQLSGGQKQRVAIARALASDPDIIIADEPTGALDAKNTDEVLKILDKIASEGKLVITVTHSDKVAAYGTRVVHMSNGKIDSDKKLRNKYAAKHLNEMKLHPLNIMNVFKMAFQQIAYNLKRNILIIFGSSIGLFSVLLMLGLGTGIKGYINNQISSQINPNSVQVTKGKAGSSSNPTKTYIGDGDIHKLSTVKGVKSVEKSAMETNIQMNYKGKKYPSQAFNTYNSSFIKKNIKHGQAPTKLNTIMLPKTIAKKMNKNVNNMVGKNIKLSLLATGKNGKQVPITKTLKVSGINSSQDQVIYVSYNTLKKMYSSKDQTLKPNFAIANIKGGISDITPTQNRIKALHGVNGKKDFKIAGMGSMITTLNTYVNLAIYVLAAIAGISLLVSAIMIIIVLFISVVERTKEIGILRALGVTKGNIRSLFFSEAIILGISASVLAVGIAYLCQFGVNTLLKGSIDYSIMQISLGNSLFIIIISLIINTLAALLPAGKAAKLDPIESLSEE